MKITSEDLIKIGFKENIVTAEEAGAENGYTYYTFDIGNDNCLLISNASDECDNNYTIEFFNNDGVEIKDFKFLIELVTIIKWNLKRNE